jgi:uncharacterized protein (DUF1330 family)
MSSAYIIANVRITNPAQYEEYKKFSSAAFLAHGVEVLARGGKVEVLEGDWTPDRMVLLKFDSIDAARAFYQSSDYVLARNAREGAAVMRMVILEGV